MGTMSRASARHSASGSNQRPTSGTIQKSPRRVGRPSKLAPEVLKRLEVAFALGVSVEVACAASGIAKSTFFNWKALALVDRVSGRHSEFLDFLDRMEAARARGIVLLHSKVYEAAMNGQWRAAVWLLSLMDPQEYGSARQFGKGRESEPVARIAPQAFVVFADRHDSGTLALPAQAVAPEPAP